LKGKNNKKIEDRGYGERNQALFRETKKKVAEGRATLKKAATPVLRSQENVRSGSAKRESGEIL